MSRTKKMYISIPDADDAEKEKIRILLEQMLEEISGKYLVFLTNVPVVQVTSKQVFDKFDFEKGKELAKE